MRLRWQGLLLLLLSWSPTGLSITTTAPPPRRIKPPTIRLLVGADGAIETAILEVSSGYPEFDNAMVSRIQRRRYKPALVDGASVSVWLREP